MSCCINLSTYNSYLPTIGPLQLAIHVVQNGHAEEQKSHWDKSNKQGAYLSRVPKDRAFSGGLGVSSSRKISNLEALNCYFQHLS